MKIIRNLISLSVFLSLWLVLFSCQKSDTPITPDNNTDTSDTIRNTQVLKVGIAHQKGTELKQMDVVEDANLSLDEKVLYTTLQGLAAKTSSEQIYLDEGGASTVFKDYMKTKYGITVANYSSLTELVNRFKQLITIKGYVLYDRANPRSVTAATALAGPMQAVAVDRSLETTVIAAGITKKMADVTNKDEKWVYANYPYAFTKKMAAELDPTVYQLLDYITLTNSFTFFDGNTAWRSSVLKALDAGAYCYGYGQDEFTMVSDASQQGVPMLPSDMAANLSILSSIYVTDGLQQRAAATTLPDYTNAHYVTFLVSDGDNIAYDLWSLYNYYTNPIRGSFGMGYTINPSLYDLAPAALRWYYEQATTNDYFVSGPSGNSYIFPSKMPSDKLNAYVNQLNTFADKTGLRICNILDQGAINRMDLWNKYLNESNIDALIYTGYGESPNGSIQFSDSGKPIIEERDNLWAGLEEESTVISNINSRSTDIHSKDAYTLVFVHAWDKNLSAIKTVVDGLNKNVHVVTPDVFVKLVQQNIAH